MIRMARHLFLLIRQRASGRDFINRNLFCISIIVLLHLISTERVWAKGNPLCFRICSDTCMTQKGFCDLAGRTAANLCIQTHYYSLLDATNLAIID